MSSYNRLNIRQFNTHEGSILCTKDQASSNFKSAPESLQRNFLHFAFKSAMGSINITSHPRLKETECDDIKFHLPKT